MKIDIQQNQGFEYLYGLPIDWDKKQMLSFGELTETILQIHSEAKSSAIRAVNRYATIRNYIIGFYIVEYEQKGNDRAVYGDRLLKRLVESIDVRGINETLLKNCRRFYVLYPQIKHLLTREKSPTISDFSEFESSAIDIVANLSFSHIVEIMTVEDSLARFFYETECVKCCWSVKELRRQISTNLYYRCGISNNPKTLLSNTVGNRLPILSIKEPFAFEFLGLKAESFNESDLENALIDHLHDFLLELGKSFCFEARQKRMIIDDEYYFADLVFYNRILHCNVIIELKNDEFKHSDLSQLNAYVSYFKEKEMNEGDNPPVGILLCTRKGKKMVEYALAGMDNHLFVSTYMLTLPDTKQLEEFLIKEIERQ
jgi:predicted nuclease of restriction endonuclease-like (RecB) superfamily